MDVAPHTRWLTQQLMKTLTAREISKFLDDRVSWRTIYRWAQEKDQDGNVLEPKAPGNRSHYHALVDLAKSREVQLYPDSEEELPPEPGQVEGEKEAGE